MLDFYATNPTESLQDPIQDSIIKSDNNILSTIAAKEEIVSISARKHLYQATVANPIHISGNGLHSGKTMNLTIAPAPINAGICFIRQDLEANHNRIPASFHLVTDTQLCTKLSNPHGAEVSTVEHLMAALAGLGIDNAVIYLDGPEVPIMDGSSEPFVNAIQSVGITVYDAKRKFKQVAREVLVEKDNAWAKLLPPSSHNQENSFIIDLQIDYPAKAIGKQHLRIEITPENFETLIANARTFCMKRDIDYMRSKNLIKGGSLDNAVVVDDDLILNAEGLRSHDEFVRHKLLDCIGDMALAGIPLSGELHAHCTGHDLNNRLLRKALADPLNFC